MHCCASFLYQGGLSTNEEMCLTFFSYYPRSNVTLCESRISVETILRDLRWVGVFEIQKFIAISNCMWANVCSI